MEVYIQLPADLQNIVKGYHVATYLDKLGAEVHMINHRVRHMLEMLESKSGKRLIGTRGLNAISHEIETNVKDVMDGVVANNFEKDYIFSLNGNKIMYFGSIFYRPSIICELCGTFESKRGLKPGLNDPEKKMLDCVLSELIKIIIQCEHVAKYMCGASMTKRKMKDIMRKLPKYIERLKPIFI